MVSFGVVTVYICLALEVLLNLFKVPYRLKIFSLLGAIGLTPAVTSGIDIYECGDYKLFLLLKLS